MKASEITNLQGYLRSSLSNNLIKVMKRPNASDSVEVMIGDEFVGVIYRDDDEDEVSYQFHMTILEEDLPG
ncbi:DUF3126 family protein [Temperatibacter marinus]|uniref:DUF3126 family protein n=1 Tax=Temperatibacter marinus TaxID=1456591 RepID=A0AA52EJ70_9PROT|nr:DUF3126 family protein [Temperatibacter marinus]WND04143.1 DUF3126 family protein [Temperatibacter marinus]